MRAIQPLADIETRAPEAGRIRLGMKSGKAMKSLDKFRFTSPFKDCIEVLAQMYGGECRPWSDPKASPSSQWEVLTDASEIQVFLPPSPVSTWYELYSGSGLQRRCDGAVCQIPQQTGPNIWEPVDNPCVCVAKNAMECSPHTRLKVLIPDVPFRGVWRLETKGWNALKELPGMADLITQLNSNGSMVRVALGIEKRTQMRPSGKRNFVTPTLTMLDSPNQILSGAARVQGVAISPPTRSVPLSIEPPAQAIEYDDIVDAVLVEEDEQEVQALLFNDAEYFGLDAETFWQAIVVQVKGRVGNLTADQLDRLRSAHQKMMDGDLVPVGIENNKITWQ
jgi:hypothetical protein